MHMHNLNLLAILVAAIATMPIGFLWYSPLLFANPWMREMGYDPNDKERIKEIQKSAGPTYFVAFIASLVSAFILALFLHHMNAHNLEYGLLIGAHVWLGFVATVQLTSALRRQHRLPTGLLPRHVRHLDPLALAQVFHGSHSIRRRVFFTICIVREIFS